jgi:hypothetical protein
MIKRGPNCFVYDRDAIERRMYVAHPVAGDVAGNILRARAWYQYLSDFNPRIRVVCPWLLDITIWDDADDDARELGLRRCLNDVSTCHAIMLVGPMVTRGMQEELQRARDLDLQIFASTGPGMEWPPGWEER